MFQKGLNPYEYMNDWEKLNESSLPTKEEIYNSLQMEDITDADDRHVKRVWKGL